MGYLDRGRRLVAEVVPYEPGLTREAAALRAGIMPEDVIKLSSNENPLGPSPEALEAIGSLATRVHEYPPSAAEALRGAIGGYLDVSPDQVVVGGGSSTLMHAIVDAFTEPGGEVISLEPSFIVYSEIATTHGRVPVTVGLREQDFLLDLDRLQEAITPKTQLIFLTRPNNPTSTLIPLADFERAARMAAEVGALIVSDEAYIEFAGDPAKASAVNLIRSANPRQPNVMATRTFSKAFGLADLRLGYAVGTSEAASYLQLANAKWPTGRLAQTAGVAAIGDTGHLAETVRIVAEGRRMLADGFAGMGFGVTPDPQGNYIMVDASPFGWTAPQFADAVFDACHILIRGDFSDRYLRISIGTPEVNQRLIDAVRKLVADRKRRA